MVCFREELKNLAAECSDKDVFAIVIFRPHYPSVIVGLEKAFVRQSAFVLVGNLMNVQTRFGEQKLRLRQ